MPYKSEEARREASRRSMEKKRQGLTKGINKEGLTEQGLTKDGTFFNGDVEYVPASYGLPERPRFLKLSDGQVLDRANQPNPNKHLPAMIACNRANDSRRKMTQQERLGRLLVSLNKEITGLDTKRVSLLGMVRYGIGGLTFKEIKDAIK